MMTDKIKDDALLSRLTHLRAGIRDFTSSLADDLIACGLAPDEAGNVVANAMLMEAWIVAGLGKLAVVGIPDPDVFGEAAAAQARAIVFDIEAAHEAFREASHD